MAGGRAEELAGNLAEELAGGRAEELVGNLAEELAGSRALLVVRHATAAGEPGVDDLERPLTKRGRADAAAAGGWLKARGLLPDRVVSSVARRATETWQHLSPAFGTAASQAALTVDPRLYEADAARLLELVREHGGGARILLTVGHNPASQQLAVDLTGRAGLSLPAGAVAVIRIRGNWSGLAPGGGELAAAWRPRPPAPQA